MLQVIALLGAFSLTLLTGFMSLFPTSLSELLADHLDPSGSLSNGIGFLNAIVPVDTLLEITAAWAGICLIIITIRFILSLVRQ